LYRESDKLHPNSCTQYILWNYSTIEWAATEGKYRARALVKHKTTIVAFNSWHQDYADAQRPIELVSNAFKQVGEWRVYNIFAETIEVHASPYGTCTINVYEVQGLIWSMQCFATP
jgi:hypothetical protein